MPTVGHAIIGFATARAQARSGRELVTGMVVYGALAVAPDLDLLPALLGHPSLVPLGHRGATHSLAAAAVVASVAALVGPRGRRGVTALAAFVAVASHALVDPLNADSTGTAILWPFAAVRLTWGAFHPIPITPVGLDALRGEGLHHLVRETVLFSPLLLYALWPRARADRVPTTAPPTMRAPPAIEVPVRRPSPEAATSTVERSGVA